MSQIESMAILGVRSFSPSEPSYIKFFSPLTLIVGSNGSGKTTIIESLRYACTGDTPPNSKGGAFVNDPKVAGTSEVKAQVKIKFKNINGERMVCSRSLAVTQRRATVTQKTIDNSLLRYDPVTGEAFSISSRCADMDAELPLHLGVPKAILDNVIFCHQEESNWPLSESSILKKKFDDIFSSKRYAVALDNIKDVKKEAVQDVKIGNVRLEALKADTLKAKKIRADLTQLNQQTAAKLNALDLIEAKIDQAQQEVTRLNDVFRDINLTSDQIQQIINKRDFYLTTIHSLKDTISPRPESTEELKRLLDEHRASENRVSDERDELMEKRRGLERKLKTAQDELSRKHTTVGKLMAAKEQMEDQMQRRIELIESINSTHNLSFSIHDGSKAAALLRKQVAALEAKQKRDKLTALNQQNTLSDELQLLKSQHMSIIESKKHLTKLIESDKIQIESLRTKLSEFDVSANEIEEGKERVEKEQMKLKQLETTSNVSSREKLTEKERELKQLDNSITNLNDEMNRLSKQSDSSAKLSLKRSEKESKEATVKRLHKEHLETIESLLGKRPDAKDLEKDLLQFKEEKERNVKELKESRNTANKEFSAAEGKIGVARHHISVRRKDIKRYETTIRAACGDNDLMDTLNATEKTIMDLREQLANIHGAELIYGKFFEKAKASKCCPLCTRGFGEDAQNDAFQGKLQTIMKRIPDQREKLNEKLKKSEEKKVRLRAAQGDWIKLEALKKDVGSIEKNLIEFESEKDHALNRADVASAELIEIESYTSKVDRLLKPAEEMSRLLKECDLLQKDITEIEDELSYMGSTRTLTDCQKDMEELSFKSQTVRRDIKRLHDDMGLARRQIQHAENNVRDAREALMNCQHKWDFRVGLDMQLKEYEENMKTHMEQLKKVENDIAPLEEQVQATTEAHEKAVDEWHRVEENMTAQQNMYLRHADRLDEFNRRIAREEASLGAGKFENAMKEISDLESLMEKLQVEIKSTLDQINVIEKDEAERRTVERDLQDQITFRERQVDLANCENELRQLQEKQGDADVELLSEQLKKAQDNETNYVDQRGSIRGELVQMRDQIRRYEAELANDYAGVDGRYGELFIDVKSKELAIGDLEKYSKVLQMAIMKYHTLKMQDLNKMIRELWVNTYQGGDIDYIEVRADDEGTTANRSFNYRVVMIQNGSELNMRGRCSAGQKVLASIIIRLALAETFCVNCGVFTLDEPTTNLDRENIESLAQSIVRIIQRKREQSNFQFVVITHDEEFVEYLSRYDILGQYYRVKKDDYQHSTITLQSENDRFTS
ncbi:hypothetical protein G6F32_004910 [Rhizopus arrhizus]|nr:hypothetical protein G6F23_002224 [Rhizopus arrhizus]KAG0768144.1 hypothetical protein G6F24_002200 [Rhizopus arrhizus]KAG0951364.1 hypothetical protein G6F32_004910 [Rhizopus arrhizus]